MAYQYHNIPCFHSVPGTALGLWGQTETRHGPVLQAWTTCFAESHLGKKVLKTMATKEPLIFQAGPAIGSLENMWLGSSN